ncbi:MAG: hypothetical protein VW916_07140, partial [Flavobacteriaceae bacterium]
GEGIEVQHYHDENLKTVYYRYFREALALNKIYPYKFTKRKFIYSFLVQSKKDIDFKFKTKNYNSRSIFDILGYRFIKNYAHLKGFNQKEIPSKKIYNYTQEDILSQNLYKHYLN